MGFTCSCRKKAKYKDANTLITEILQAGQTPINDDDPFWDTLVPAVNIAPQFPVQNVEEVKEDVVVKGIFDDFDVEEFLSHIKK